jgi:hypothetical protein
VNDEAVLVNTSILNPVQRAPFAVGDRPQRSGLFMRLDFVTPYGSSVSERSVFGKASVFPEF